MDHGPAFRHFKTHDPILHAAARKVQRQLAPRRTTLNPDRLFASLAESVVSQQLSVKAADTIWERLTAICGGEVTPRTIRATSLPRLRKAGLSAAKVKTLKALARAVERGLHLPALKKKSPEAAAAALTEIWGIGPWTADMFLMFGLGHPDIFSARDLGLVRAMEALYGLTNPSLETLEAIAERWSPHRTLACRILWKTRDSGT